MISFSCTGAPLKEVAYLEGRVSGDFFFFILQQRAALTGREGFPAGPASRGRQWKQDSLIPWPQVTSCASCCSEEEPEWPQVSSGPRGIPVEASLRGNLRAYPWEPWLFSQPQGWLGAPGVVRWDALWEPHSAAQTPNPRPPSKEKTTCKYQLFIPFCCLTPFKYFHLEETFQQKQKNKNTNKNPKKP